MKFVVTYFLCSFIIFITASLLYFGTSVNNEKFDFFEWFWKKSVINLLFSFIVLSIVLFI